MWTLSNRRSTFGFTLLELLLLIVVFAIGLTGMLVVFNTTVADSADPMVRKQAMAAAESMMDEILLQPFDAGGWSGVATQANRPQFDDVRDYAGFATNGIYKIDDAPFPSLPTTGLGNFDVAVQVADTTLSGVNDALLVTVTVTGPNISYVLDGYKLDW